MRAHDDVRPLWTPTEAFARDSAMQAYIDWLARERGLSFASYDALWQWSVTELEAFWQSIWDYFGLRSATPVKSVLAARDMPGARWFEGATLNYAAQVFRNVNDALPAVLHAGEQRPLTALGWEELRGQVASLAAALRAMGVQRGDRVAAYLPNIPETIVAFLATASIGAVWSLCAPDMGQRAVLDRFSQIEPKVLIAVDSYHHGGKLHERADVLAALRAGLPGVRHVIGVPRHGQAAVEGTRDWSALVADHVPLQIDDVPFDHPLWIVYSSGTTGMPKPIVHGHGGIVIEQLKMMTLHSNIRSSDVFHWYTSSGWIMWNAQVAGLLCGATIAIYDGSPAYPDFGRLWRFVEEAGVTVFGAGSAFFGNCMKAGIAPARIADLSRLKALGATGSPLAPEVYDWIYREVRGDIWLAPMSGGTDFAGCFVAGCPLLPVHAGEMQCRCLGARVEAYDDQGRPLIDAVGELVCAAPMPSMPLYFWNDPEQRRYRDSYFDMYPGVWRHGDWLRITPRGGAVIYGRSDATINRQGIRMGTSELYRVVEDLPEVLDSLVVDLEYLGRPSFMALFVVMRPGIELDEALKVEIRARIRSALSARHVPDAIEQAPDVPRTLSGKKMEVPIKKLMLGRPLAEIASPDAMANPACLAWYGDCAARHQAGLATS